MIDNRCIFEESEGQRGMEIDMSEELTRRAKTARQRNGPDAAGTAPGRNGRGVLCEKPQGFQHLAVGDKSLLGREELTVTALGPPRALVLSYKARGIEWVWQFALYPVDNNRTRLVRRGTERVPNTAGGWLHARHGACGNCHDAADAAGSETARRNA